MTIHDPSDEQIERVAAAIEAARCPDREGPYGLYDYSGYPGDGPAHHVRDFRDYRSSTYGHSVLRTHDKDEAQREYDRLTRRHIALAAIYALVEP